MKNVRDLRTFKELFDLYREHMRRSRARFTRQQLAKQLGISLDELDALAHGRVRPRAPLARRLLAILEGLKNP